MERGEQCDHEWVIELGHPLHCIKCGKRDATPTTSNCEVVHEEIITHPTLNQETIKQAASLVDKFDPDCWRGEARVIVAVKINGRLYECNQIVSLLFTNQSEMEDFKRVAAWITGDSGDSELGSGLL